MAKTYDEVRDLLKPLENEYEERHSAHRRLRKFWHGRYWENTEVDTRGMASIFRDLTAPQSDVGPDYKLVYNIVKDVCVKYQTFLSPLPMIRYYVDPPSTATRRNQATVKERFTYGMWAANNMNKLLANNGWYLPLMGDCFLGIYPDLDKKMVRAILRSPEYAYPLQNWEQDGIDGTIFMWKAKQAAVKRAFPNWSPDPGTAGKSFFSMAPGKRRAAPADPDVEILEFTDDGEFQRWVGGKRVAGVEHDFGFDLFEQMKFINVPGEVWGHGAVEQAVNLNEMANAYLSLMMQSAIENVFPVMVIVDPQKSPEFLERGAGAVIPVNQGGDVKYLQPPAGNLIAQSDWYEQIERMVKTDTSMPDVNFGVAQNSVITGKAINELQGAGTGTLVEMVQGVSIGAALASWNEKAVHLGRTLFKDDTLHLYGIETGSVADINPRNFALNIKGSQLVGSTRNEVVFMPNLDMQSKVVMGLQLAGAGLVSRKWQRDNVGIPDSEAMDEEIVSETIQDAVMSMLVQAITGPDNAGDTENQIDSLIEGRPMPHPLLAGPMPPGGPSSPGPGSNGPPVAPLPGPGGGQVMGTPLKLPPGAPAPQPEPQPSAAQPGQMPGDQTGGIKLDQAIQAFQSLQGVQGRIFLVGEIVAEGQTSDPLDVRITEPADRNVVGQTQLPMQVKVINGEPNEPYIEVTPGATPTTQGEAPQPEEAL